MMLLLGLVFIFMGLPLFVMTRVLSGPLDRDGKDS